ncbi:hypothetical protein V7793_26135 [Streptomyces sp. KLMMK]|uniref:hypothetical protein n=1 Tax=Streptomyces sp. KLMMK TaxID=3109353 RepID=UPI00300ABA36
MADEPLKKTPIQNKYAQQYADDLAANREEQGSITEQIAGLQERLEQLKVEEIWLAQARGSLPGAPAPSEPEASAPADTVAKAPQTVPSPRQGGSVKAEQPAKKATAKRKTTTKKAAAKKTTARATAKKTTAKASAKTAAEKPAAEQAAAPEAAAPKTPAGKSATEEKSGPPLWQLALDILLKAPGQPCVAREVADQLAQDHPSRKTTIQTVRNTLETLIKKNLAEKSHQQGSAMYTAYADAGAAPAADGTADREAEQGPEMAVEKAPAEV